MPSSSSWQLVMPRPAGTQAAVVRSCRRDTSSALAALGGVFFVASDATLAIDRFVAPLPGAVVVVLATYWSAQALIGLSVRKLQS